MFYQIKRSIGEGRRTMQFEIDEKKATQLQDLDKKYLWHHITQHQIFEKNAPEIMVEGAGCVIKDINGKEYLDATSGGVWCVNAGYGRNQIVDAMSEQQKKLPFFASTLGSVPSILLAEKIVSLLPEMQKVYFCNTGSEANEKAFKMVRQYFKLKEPDKNKYKVIYRDRDFHGGTFAALAATGQGERRKDYEPLAPGFHEMPACYCYRCSFGKSYPGCNLECARSLEETIIAEGEETVGAVILEPITSGGGVIVPPNEYFKVIQEICQKYEILMIMDEVVNGYGRTGKMFGHHHFDVDPDMVTMAKGFTSAYAPLSALAVKEKIFNQFVNDASDHMSYFRDISTYPGCAGMTAGALENLKIIEAENLCENSEKMGAYLLEGLKEIETLPLVGDVRGKGLLVGVELVSDKGTKTPVSESTMAQITSNIKSQGVLVGRMNRSVPGRNNVLFIAPPLIINKDEVEKIISAISSALAKFK